MKKVEERGALVEKQYFWRAPKLANKDCDLQCKWNTTFLYPIIQKQRSDQACSGITHYRPLESVVVTHYDVKHLYH